MFRLETKNYIYKNNRGASLVIIIAVFALFMVLCLNILMAANNTTTNMSNEYEADKIDLYVSSLYKTINAKFIDGGFVEAFEKAGDKEDKATIITFDGYEYNNKSVQVEAKIVKPYSTYAEVYYKITINGKEYNLIGTYKLIKANKKIIGVKSIGCSGIEY